jgi:methyl-accepting chemotaxis protein
MATKLNRRKKLLINPEFQVKFMKNLVFLNIAICATFYAAQSYFFWQARELGKSIALPSDHVFFLFIAEQQRTMTFISLATMAAVSLIIMVFGLVYSHRIAGPVYRLQKYLKDKAAGNENGKLNFRENDYFPEMAEAVNDYIYKTAGAKKSKSNKKVA